MLIYIYSNLLLNKRKAKKKSDTVNKTEIRYHSANVFWGMLTKIRIYVCTHKVRNEIEIYSSFDIIVVIIINTKPVNITTHTIQSQTIVCVCLYSSKLLCEFSLRYHHFNEMMMMMTIAILTK